MIANLVLATAMTALTTGIHFAGLVFLIALLRRAPFAAAPHQAKLLLRALWIVSAVLGLFALHTVEIWAYAILFKALGAFPSFEDALYFSTSTFTTVGFGDLVADRRWRLLAAIESANGFLLIGWSTAFLISLTARLRMWEAEFEQARGLDPDDA